MDLFVELFKFTKKQPVLDEVDNLSGNDYIQKRIKNLFTLK